jgi:hypothetical protein
LQKQDEKGGNIRPHKLQALDLTGAAGFLPVRAIVL